MRGKWIFKLIGKPSKQYTSALLKNGVSMKANVIMDRPYSSSNRNSKNMSLAPSTLVTRNSTAVNSAVTPIMTAYRIPQENLETEITGKLYNGICFQIILF